MEIIKILRDLVEKDGHINDGLPNGSLYSGLGPVGMKMSERQLPHEFIRELINEGLIKSKSQAPSPKKCCQITEKGRGLASLA